MSADRLPEEAYDTDLEWFLVMGDAAMGERGTLAGTVAQLEHGGPFTGVPSTDLYTDQQVGFSGNTTSLVERHRCLSVVWLSLDRKTRRHLESCYRAPPAAFRSDEGFGATDACPRVEDIDNRLADEPQKPTAFHHRQGTEGQLGRLAALAFELCPNPAALLIACQDPRKGKAPRVIAQARKLAAAAAKAAHDAWRAARAAAPRPRTRRERIAALPPHNPEEATE